MLAALALPSGSVVLTPADLMQCTPAVARRLTVEDLAADQKRYVGQCVTVAGPTRLGATYGSVEGAYLSTHLSSDWVNPANSALHRIGLYVSEKLDRANPALRNRVTAQFTGLSVTGIVDTCRAMEDRLPPPSPPTADTQGEVIVSVHMLAGYCHSYDGAVVWVTSGAAIAHPPYVRLRGEEARRRYGDLVRPSTAWRHWSETVRFAEDVRSAIGLGQRQRLDRLLGRSDLLDYILIDPLSPFKGLRRANDASLEIFLDPQSAKHLSRSDNAGRNVVICYCRVSDCAGRWPISRIDADPDPDHPYACVEREEDDSGHLFGGVLGFVDGRAALEEGTGSRLN